MATVIGKRNRGRSVEGFNHDGLELARRRRIRRALPIRQILLFLLAVVSFKVFLFLNLGGATYGAKMAELAEGALIERVAARAMAMDPVSNYLVRGFTHGTW